MAPMAHYEQRISQLEVEVRELRTLLQERLEQESMTPVLRLLEAGRLEEARELVGLLLKASTSPKLKRWAQILAPAEVRVSPGAKGAPFSRNAAWLRKNAAAYRGKWVALRGGKLLGAGEDRVALHHRLKRDGSLKGVLFARL